MFMLSILDTNLCLVCSRLCNDKRLAEEVVRLEGLVRLVELCKNESLSTRFDSFFHNFTSWSRPTRRFHYFSGWFFLLILVSFFPVIVQWQTKKWSDLKDSSDSSNCVKNVSAHVEIRFYVIWRVRRNLQLGLFLCLVVLTVFWAIFLMYFYLFFQIVQWQTTGRRSCPTWRSRPTRRTLQKRIGARRKWWSAGCMSCSSSKNCRRSRTWEIQKSRCHGIGGATSARFISDFFI